MENYFPIIFLFIYVYFAYSIQTIANKTGTANSWMAWIPILNVYLLIKIADRPGWWMLLLLVPLINIIISVMVWMGVSEARGKPNWLGILMIFPFINFIIPGYLAFSE